MGAWAPISDSKDIFIDEDAGFAAVNAAPLKALEKNHNIGKNNNKVEKSKQIYSGSSQQPWGDTSVV